MSADQRPESLGRRIRVLHVNHSEEFGGAELSLRRMLNAGPPWQPLLLLPTGGEGNEAVFSSLDQAQVRVLRSGAPSAVGASGITGPWNALGFVRVLLSQAWAVHRAQSEERADFVWANSSRSAVYCVLGLLVSRVRLVVHLRDRVDRESLGTVGFTLMSKFVLPRADGVVANSRSTLDSAAGFLRRTSRAIVIPSASGLSGDNNGNDRVAAANEDDSTRALRIAMLARIDPWKGQALLVDAFASAKRILNTSIKLHLAGAPEFGNEPYLIELKEQVRRLGLEDDVVFEGRISDVNGFLSAMDICVQYSTRPEPLGQNVLQYLASGTVVVAAAEGGPADWVTHDVNGVLVEPRSVGALAMVLVDLLRNPERRLRLSQAARRTPGLLTDSQVCEAAHKFLSQFEDQGREA